MIQRIQNALRVERLDNVIARAETHGLDGGLQCPLLRHDDAHELSRYLVRGSQQVESVRIRQAQVHKHQVDRLRPQDVNGLPFVRRRMNGGISRTECGAEQLAHSRLIVRNEDATCAIHFSRPIGPCSLS